MSRMIKTADELAEDVARDTKTLKENADIRAGKLPKEQLPKARVLLHFDANIRGRLVEMFEHAHLLAEYLNKKGYEGRYITALDIALTLVEQIKNAERGLVERMDKS
jgi:hypothetical protein